MNTPSPRRSRAANVLRRVFRLSGPDEVDEEFRFHLDLRVGELVARGWDPGAARAEAQRQFGDVEGARNYCRATHAQTEKRAMRVEFLGNLAKDFVLAFRGWRRSPGFTVVALLILALAIGANTAIFSVVRGVLLKPLGYPEPERLVLITSQFSEQGQDQFAVDAAEFFEFRERAKSFEDVGAYSIGAVDVGAESRPQRVTAATVSAGLFGTLGVAPVVGRNFNPEETVPGAPRAALLSYELWSSTYGADRKVVGSSVDINGAQTMIVGVMPRDFDVHDNGVKVWLPLRLDPAQRAQYRGGHFLMLVGRLRRGVSLERARDELQGMLTQWATLSAAPQKNAVPNTTTHRLRYDDLRTDIVGNARTALWVLQVAVGVVLLIACANLANLLLMRAEQRHRELAVRVALGARSGRLLQQFVVESLVLSFTGGAAGVVLAQWGLRAMVAANAGGIPRSASIALDLPVLAFALLLVLGTSALFGLVPLLHLNPRAIGQTLREAGSRTTSGNARSRIRRLLVVSEIAMAAVLVISATLLTRSFLNLIRVDAGFDRSRLTTFEAALPTGAYRDITRRLAFFDDLVSALGSTPGVDAVAAMRGLPPARQADDNSTDMEGVPIPTGDISNNVDFYQAATPGYFAAMGIPVAAGRAFDQRDGPSATPVAMINEALAKKYYPGQDPVGRHIRPAGDTTWLTIVGVAKDVKQSGLGSTTGTELYFVYEQIPRQRFGVVDTDLNIVVRSRLTTAALTPIIRNAVRALDTAVPVARIRSMDEVFSDSVNRPRFLAQLLGIFAVVAIVLAAIGTYGVLAYSVTIRHREIGIHLALGASARNVLSMVLAQGMTLAVVGLTVGLVAAAGTTRLAASLLFGVRAGDPATFATVALLLLAIAFIACLVPARRATRVDPVTTLRAD